MGAAKGGPDRFTEEPFPKLASKPPKLTSVCCLLGMHFRRGDARALHRSNKGKYACNGDLRYRGAHTDRDSTLLVLVVFFNSPPFPCFLQILEAASSHKQASAHCTWTQRRTGKEINQVARALKGVCLLVLTRISVPCARMGCGLCWLLAGSSERPTHKVASKAKG